MFIEGCVKNGMTMAKMPKIYVDKSEPFAGYGFGKAHAASLCNYRL